MWMESTIDDPKVQNKGISILVDVGNTPWRLIRWLTPHNINVGLRKLEVLPVKDIVFHVVNTTFILNACINIIWPFLSSKHKDMVSYFNIQYLFRDFI